jgi:hypothetical protein
MRLSAAFMVFFGHLAKGFGTVSLSRKRKLEPTVKIYRDQQKLTLFFYHFLP